MGSRTGGCRAGGFTSSARAWSLKSDPESSSLLQYRVLFPFRRQSVYGEGRGHLFPHFVNTPPLNRQNLALLFVVPGLYLSLYKTYRSFFLNSLRAPLAAVSRTCCLSTEPRRTRRPGVGVAVAEGPGAAEGCGMGLARPLAAQRRAPRPALRVGPWRARGRGRAAAR